MSFDPHARRFNPRRTFPANETTGEKTSEAPDEFLLYLIAESPTSPVGQEFDLALEQIASAGCCVCPLCGAIVASDRSVLS
jgi:hypothetical protein